MKFFDSRKKLAVTASLVAALMTGSLAYAASAVKQDAYYDTFRFVVNGSEQAIADPALKPFVANSRVYVPMATLNSLGIAGVQWTPASGGAGAVLTVTPRGGADTTQLAVLQQQIAAATATVSAKETENKKLLDENNSLKEEIRRLKEKANDSVTSSGNLNDSKVKSLNEYYYRYVYNTYFEDVYKKDDKNQFIKINFEASASAYRDQLDVEMTSRRFDSVAWNDYLKSIGSDDYEMRRYIQRNIVDPAISEFKDVKDLRLNIVVYNGDRRSGNRIATASYDRGRLTVRLD